jgi:hypothetical protein
LAPLNCNIRFKNGNSTTRYSAVLQVFKKKYSMLVWELLLRLCCYISGFLCLRTKKLNSKRGFKGSFIFYITICCGVEYKPTLLSVYFLNV